MNKHMRLLGVLSLPGLALALGFGTDAEARRRVETVELDEAEVFIEWNSTDDDYGIHFFWDGEPWKSMVVKNHRGKVALSVRPQRNVRRQGLTEAFFESAEPPTDELSLEEFLERHPEGDYTFRGRTLEGDRLVEEAEFTHTLPAPATNLVPNEDDVVSHEGFEVSFDFVTLDTEGDPIDIEYYEVVVEKDDDEPILQVFKVILPPDRNSVMVPAEFLEPDTEYKLEILAQEESGNRTAVETGLFTTTSDE